MGVAPPLTTDPRLQQLLALSLPGGAPDWLNRLLRWLHEASPSAPPGEPIPRTGRLRALAAALAEHPQSEVLTQRLAASFSHASVVRLLAETGIPVQSTIMKEVTWRLGRRFIPRPAQIDDIPDLLSRGDPTLADAAWIEGLSPDDVATWAPIIGAAPARLLEAAHVCGVRAAATGIGPELDVFRAAEALPISPFLDLGPMLAECRQRAARGEALPDWQAPLRACRSELDRIEHEIEKRGVSTEAVFRVEALETLLARVGSLMLLATRPTVRDGQQFVGGLMRATSEQRSLRGVFRTATKRLSRKIVEYAGETGEHYTVRSRQEWREHFNEGTAAGFLTSFTAIGKYAIAALPLAPVVAGLGYWANYSASFCLMQVNHWLLASKQPAMTAAALAATMQHGGNEDEIELIAGITRSQTAVTLSNGFATMSLAVLLDLVFRLLTGRHILSIPTAVHGIQAINPIASLTVIYAITTGISLWLASLAAGWAANWSAYRRLPEGVESDPRVLRVLSKRQARWLAGFVRRNLSGIAGYIVLGMLLGFVPVLFQRFLGISLEVRHITLQAASVALTYGPLADAGLLTTRAVAWSIVGIAVTGMLNFSVSFYLSLRTALRARDLDAGQRKQLWRDLRAAFRADPWRFFWAPTRPPVSMVVSGPT